MKFYPILLLSLLWSLEIFAQGYAGCPSEPTCVKRKNQYIDYSKFVLRENEHFNTPKNTNVERYLKSKGWTLGAFKGNKYNNTDTVTYEALELDGDNLIIKALNWKPNKDIPSFKKAAVHKSMTSLLGLYEMRVKVASHPAAISTGWFWWSYRYEFDIFEYKGKNPYRIPANTWGFFPHEPELGYEARYPSDLCRSYDTKNSIWDNVKIDYKPNKVEFDEKYNRNQLHYNTKKCYCQKFYCMKEPLHYEYHTFQYVLTPTETAIFLDGVLLGVHTLGGTDASSICPLTIKDCRKRPLAVMSLVIGEPFTKKLAHANNFDRNKLRDDLLNGKKVEYAIDYFKKYDFKSEADFPSYVKEYQSKVAIETRTQVNSSPNLGIQKMANNAQGIVAYWNDNGQLVQWNKKQKKANGIKILTTDLEPIDGSDIAIDDENRIFYIHKDGYMAMAEVNQDGTADITKVLGGTQSKIPKMAVTPFRDFELRQYKGLTEIYATTKSGTVGRFINLRTRWFFQDLTEQKDVKVAGDLAVSGNGIVAYKGEDGAIHAVKAAGKSQNIKRMEVTNAPNVSTAEGAIVSTQKGDIIYIAQNNHLALLSFIDGEYQFEWLNGANANDCERAFGALTIFENHENKRLFYRGENSNVLSFTHNGFWYVDWLGQPFNLAKSKERKTYTTSRFWRFFRGFEQSDIIVDNENTVYFFDKNQNLQTYFMEAASIHPNNPNYAPYSDEIEECRGYENIHHSFTNIEDIPVEHFLDLEHWEWFDALGQPLKSWAFTSKEELLRAEDNMPQGVYFIKIRTDEVPEVIKLVKT